MKKMMITGGLMGFSTGVVFGLMERSGWPAVVWFCIAAGVVGCWLQGRGSSLGKSLQLAYSEKMHSELKS
jgi:hypothetical protein